MRPLAGVVALAVAIGVLTLVGMMASAEHDAQREAERCHEWVATKGWPCHVDATIVVDQGVAICRCPVTPPSVSPDHRRAARTPAPAAAP